jgi:hypothetical protein
LEYVDENLKFQPKQFWKYALKTEDTNPIRLEFDDIHLFKLHEVASAF